MLLMTFVENIFKHGVDKSSSHNMIDISLIQQDGYLLFQTRNHIHENQTQKLPMVSGYRIYANVLPFYSEQILN
jgi:sensor histidine kinase YesM